MNSENLMKTLCFLFVCVALTLGGCKSEQERTFDLSQVESKVEMGMTEFKVVNSAGAPNKIEAGDGWRELRYEAPGGKEAVIVKLVGDRVISVDRKSD